MKLTSLFALLLAALILSVAPVTVRETQTGWQLASATADAYTYRRARVTARRYNRRSYRYARRYNRAAYYTGAAYVAPRRVCRCY